MKRKDRTGGREHEKSEGETEEREGRGMSDRVRTEGGR